MHYKKLREGQAALATCNTPRRQWLKARLVKVVNTVDLKSALLEGYRFKSDSEQSEVNTLGPRKVL